MQQRVEPFTGVTVSWVGTINSHFNLGGWTLVKRRLYLQHLTCELASPQVSEHVELFHSHGIGLFRLNSASYANFHFVGCSKTAGELNFSVHRLAKKAGEYARRRIPFRKHWEGKSWICHSFLQIECLHKATLPFQVAKSKGRVFFQIRDFC